MNILANILADARFSLRLLRRSPGFAVTLLGVLTLGLGASTAMFSLVVSVILRPLPYAEPEQLSAIHETQSADHWSGPVSLPDFIDWRSQATSFSGMAAVKRESFSLSTAFDRGAAPESVPAAAVTADYFRLLGLSPLRGRLLDEGDDRADAPRVAVVSAALWRRRFGADEGIVGKAIVLDARPFVVVGVAPEGFNFASYWAPAADVWTALAATDVNYALLSSEEMRSSHFLSVLARRKPGVSVAAAQSELDVVTSRLAALHPASNTNVGARVEDLKATLTDGSRSTVWILFAAVGLVFLVVCANVANLLLARASGRQHELAVRAALGATRARIIGQIVVETVVVFALGALGAMVAAQWLVRLFAASVVDPANAGAVVGPERLLAEPHVEWSAFGFAVALAVVCGALFGLVPAAVASRVAPQTAMKEGSSRAGSGRAVGVLRGGLVVAQVAIAFSLLVGAGLSVRAFLAIDAAPDGFDPRGLVAARIALPAAKYREDDAKSVRFFESVRAAVAAQPGVSAVSVTRSVPGSPLYSNGSFRIEGRPPFPTGDRPNLERNVVTDGHFAAMGIAVLRGRELTVEDTAESRPVMLLGKRAAERFFPGEDPIGRRISLSDDAAAPWLEIVGVVADVPVKARGGKVLLEAYLPLAQQPTYSLAVVARTQNEAALLDALPGIVAKIDPEQSVVWRRVVAEMVASSTSSQRIVSILLAAFAGVALFLATLGLFGLVAYTTSQRTRELGIRIALGASPERVIGVVIRQGISLLGVGLAFGAAGALLVGRSVAEHVNGGESFSASVFVSILAVLAVAGTLASLVPALRAVRIPPASALRYE